MHPADHRGLRELYVVTRHQRDHWRALAERLQDSAGDAAQLLRKGSEVARTLLAELQSVSAARGVHGRPAAQGLGARMAAMHSVLLDSSLEVNQALRIAVLDVVYVVTLLDYLAGLAREPADEELARFLGGWAERMRAQERLLRAAAIAVGEDPRVAVAAATPGAVGRAAHGLAAAVGTAGEWVDARAAR